jgi:hypothetical protein
MIWAGPDDRPILGTRRRKGQKRRRLFWTGVVDHRTRRCHTTVHGAGVVARLRRIRTEGAG